MFKLLGRWTTAHPVLVCLGWLLAGVALTVVAPPWDAATHDDDVRFLPADSASARAHRLLQEAFPADVFASRVVFALERPDRPLAEADFALADRLLIALRQLAVEAPTLPLGRVHSFRDPYLGKRLVSEDGHCLLIPIDLGTPFLALQTRAAVDQAEERLRSLVAVCGPDAPRLHATGPAGVGRDLVAAGAGGLDATTIATVALVVIVLLCVYRAPLLALVPLATVAVSVWVSLELLALLTRVPGVYLMNVSKIFAIVILYGAGTDYCLFLISRYREQLGDGQLLPEAVCRAVGSVGGAIAASAGTVICGLGLMGLAEFAKVRCAGPAIALSLVVALAASLTLAPALLCLLGRFVFWPGRVPLPTDGEERPDLWERLSRGVVARPALVWSAAALGLLPLALVGVRVTAAYNPTAELSPTSTSVTGLVAIQRHFNAGETGPITVLLTAPEDWRSPMGRKLIAHLTRGFANLNNVAEVRSMTHPLGTELPEEEPTPVTGPARLLASVRKGVRERVGASVYERYCSTATGLGGQTAHVTRLDVVPKTDPFGPESVRLLGHLEIWLRDQLPGDAARFAAVRGECHGVTVGARDLAVVTERDRRRVNGFVLAGIFVILMILVRRPWLAAYLLVTVVFSYLATLGATTLFATWCCGRPFGEVDWRVPFFLFTILVAVGEDYNIFLISRVLKERRRHGSEEGVRRALARTGGTITSCGVIMAGTFATLMLTGLATLVQIGFALAVGVLLDTFVVRPFLVPALAVLAWRVLERPSTSESEAATTEPARELRQAA